MPPQPKKVLMAKTRANHNALWEEISAMLDAANIPKTRTTKTSDRLRRVMVALAEHLPGKPGP